MMSRCLIPWAVLLRPSSKSMAAESKSANATKCCYCARVEVV